MSLRFEDFTLDLQRRELRRQGDLLTLEPKVFDLLAFLIQNRERVVTRDELITRLQDFAHDHPIYRVLVYFDGQKTTVKRAGSVEIRFTPGQKPADFYIVETLRALGEAERQRALLVTADRALADAARKLGAKVEAPSSFHRRLAGARRTSIGERGLSAAEVADWEAYFQQPPDQGKKPGKPGSRS